MPVLAINLYAGYKVIDQRIHRESTVHTVSAQEHMSSNANVLDNNVAVSSQNENSEKREEKLPQNDANTSSDNKENIDKLCEKIKNSNISDEDLRRELNNILVYRVLCTDMSDEEWNELFGNLQRTLPETCNAVEYYYPLATYLHQQECLMEHSTDSDGVLTCNTIMDEVLKIQKEWEYMSYISEMVYSSLDNDVITSFDRLCNSCNDIIKAMDEMKVLYEYMQVPRCLSEEELMANFSTLQGTVTEYENIFEVYRKLAIFMHLLDCDYEHYVDECDVHICKGLEKRM